MHYENHSTSRIHKNFMRTIRDFKDIVLWHVLYKVFVVKSFAFRKKNNDNINLIVFQ